MISIIAFTLVVLFLVSYLFILPVIRYFLDPKGLRKYPNYSWLSPLTDLRHCYLSAHGFRSRDLYLEHKRRGEPVLRIGPNALSFYEPRAVKDIYGHGTSCTKDIKESVLAGTHRHLFDVVDKPHHAKKRKLLSAAFALKNLEKWEFKVAYTAERLFKQFDKHCTAPMKESDIPNPADVNVDFNHWINLWTIEAILNMVLSAEVDLLDTGKDDITAEKLDGTLYKSTYRRAQNLDAWFSASLVWDYDLWPWVKWICATIPGQPWRKVHLEGRSIGDVYYHQAANRLKRYQAGEKLDDFFTCLMEDKAGMPNNLEWGEIAAEVAAIINAGNDTTAIALTQHLFLLMKHPHVLKKLREEVDAVLDQDDDDMIASYDKVKDLPYLRAVIDEGLRILPPTSAGLPRRTPAEGSRIMGEWIPGDTSVSMTIYGSHRLPEAFPNPEEYRPERFLNDEERRRMEPYYMPFSAGARGCIGRNISILEQVMFLASFVHRYEFAMRTPDFELERKEAFNILMGELPIKIWKRKIEAE